MPAATTAPPARSNIQFGAMPAPNTIIRRYPSSYTRSTESESSSSHSGHSSHSAKSSKTGKQSQQQQGATDFDSILKPGQIRSMAEIDEEEEARMQKTGTAKAKKMRGKLLLGLVTKIGSLGKGKKGV
ncbi:hypothetical protein PTMSG1_03391 [Pyrenophora teres f. maculata]|nr:hypothetical protein PTMSG1_03391 [Pyrenophora teres f. maculata]